MNIPDIVTMAQDVFGVNLLDTFNAQVGRLTFEIVRHFVDFFLGDGQYLTPELYSRLKAPEYQKMRDGADAGGSGKRSVMRFRSSLS
jgi:hypothetical protein